MHGNSSIISHVIFFLENTEFLHNHTNGKLLTGLTGLRLDVKLGKRNVIEVTINTRSNSREKNYSSHPAGRCHALLGKLLHLK